MLEALLYAGSSVVLLVLGGLGAVVLAAAGVLLWALAAALWQRVERRAMRRLTRGDRRWLVAQGIRPW
jgi:uncharacterized membrane protein YidH (DUF202 family)